MPDAERTTVRAIMDTQREVFEQGREQGRQEARRETAQELGRLIERKAVTNGIMHDYHQGQANDAARKLRELCERFGEDGDA